MSKRDHLIAYLCLNTERFVTNAMMTIVDVRLLGNPTQERRGLHPIPKQ